MNGIRLSLLTIALSVCHAENISSVRGRVETNSLVTSTPLVVVLESSEPWKGASESTVNSDGSFEFRDVNSGVHRLRLVSSMGETIKEELVDVGPAHSLSIHLPQSSSAKPISGLVSAHRLMNPTPKKAVKAFADAQKESEKGRFPEAAAKLEQAVNLDPNYFEARTNLGVQYMRLGRQKEALEQFEKVAEIAPPSAPVFANLAIGLMANEKFGEAADTARRALDLDRTQPAAHFVLGGVLSRGVGPGSMEKAQEALNHLRQGAVLSPRVHMEIARIDELTGDRLDAVAEIRTYLKSGDPAYRADAERWLAKYE